MTALIGVDPSSKKIAYVISHDTDDNVTMGFEELPPGGHNRPEACELAVQTMKSVVESARHYAEEDVWVFIESPVLGRGGAGATIPQAMIVGALMAGAKQGNAYQVQLVPVQVWKKDIVGSGNAGKPDVAQWVKDHHPSLHKLWVGKNNLGKTTLDQDIYDALCINVYGRMVLARTREIEHGRPVPAVKNAPRPRQPRSKRNA